MFLKNGTGQKSYQWLWEVIIRNPHKGRFVDAINIPYLVCLAAQNCICLSTVGMANGKSTLIHLTTCFFFWKFLVGNPKGCLRCQSVYGFFFFIFLEAWLGSFTLISFPDSSDGEESACIMGDQGSVPGLARPLGEGNGNPLQAACLENPMDRGAWMATVQGSQRAGLDWETNTHLFTLKACLTLWTTSSNEFFSNLFSSILWRPLIFPLFWYHGSFLVTSPNIILHFVGLLSYGMTQYTLSEEGNGSPLQYSCLDKLMDRGAWQATIQGLQRVGHGWAMEHAHNIVWKQLIVTRKTCELN